MLDVRGINEMVSRSASVLMFLLLLLNSGCSSTVNAKPQSEGEQQEQFLKKMGESTLKEIQRVTSPSGFVDAVLCQRSTNATVSTPTEVYLVKRSESPSEDPIFRADHVEAAAISWQGPSKLKVSARQARTFVTLPSAEVDLGQSEKNSVEIEYAIEKTL
jgi:hypothetical protein